MKTSEALNTIIDLLEKNHLDQWDVLASESESLSVELFESKIKNTDISKSRGLGIRLFYNSQVGYAYTEDFSHASISRTVQDAIDSAKITDPLFIDLPHPKPLPKISLYDYDDSIKDIDIAQLKSLALDLESLAKTRSHEIENIPYLGAGKSMSTYSIRNSNGVSFDRKKAAVSTGIGLLLARGDSKKMGSNSNGARRKDLLNIDDIAKNAVSRGSGLLGAMPVPSGEYMILFRNRIASQIFSMFSSVFFAETSQKGLSKLKGKLGKSIAIPSLSLYSDPFQKDLPGSKLFDTEGVLSKKISVIENGVFNSFLYNLESAKRENVSPTGTGSRGYFGKASTSFSNLMVPTSHSSLEEIMHSQDEILMIEKLEGGAGCSAISGEISIGAQGYLLKKGKILQPVDRITIAGNFFSMLENILAISNEYSNSFSSIKVPDLLIKGFYVAS